MSKTNTVPDIAESDILVRGDIKYIFKCIFINYDNGYKGSYGKTVQGGPDLGQRVKEGLLNDI